MTELNQNILLEQGFPLPITITLEELQSSGTREDYTTGDFTNWRGMFVASDLQNTPVIVVTTTTAPAGLASKFTDIADTGLTLDDTNSRATLTLTASNATLPPGTYQWGLYLYNAAGTGQVFSRGTISVKAHPGY